MSANPQLADWLQWTALVTSASACFIAAGISYWVFVEQRRTSREFQQLIEAQKAMRDVHSAGEARDEFIRWLLAQSIQLQEDTYVLSEMVAGAGANPTERNNLRIDQLRKEITRKVYELRVFSGNDRAVRTAVNQLISTFGDHRSLAVLELAARTLNGPIRAWLQIEHRKLRAKLFPPQFIDSRAWTG